MSRALRRALHGALQGKGLAISGFVTFVILLAVGSSSKWAHADGLNEKSAGGNWFASVVVSDRSGYRFTNYWSRGPSLRAETLLGVHPMTTIVHGDRYWVYDELSNQGIEINRSTAAILADAKRGRPFGDDLQKLVREGGEKIEVGLLSGIQAETWKMTNTVGRRVVWVTVSEPKVPLRVENFDRESGGVVTLSYSNWTSGVELSTQFFVPPAGLELQRFEYDEYVSEALKGTVGSLPILYPELLHGPRSG